MALKVLPAREVGGNKEEAIDHPDEAQECFLINGKEIEAK